MSRAKKSWGFPRWGDYGVDTDPVGVRICDFEGCAEKADHPAPKSPSSDERWWFCIGHAAEYNKNWNFFEGLSGDQAREYAAREARTNAGYSEAGTYSWGGGTDKDGVSRVEREALEALELDSPASPAEIKARFRKLAKELHPDRNPGDAKAEKAFHRVRAAYDLLSGRSKSYRGPTNK